MSAATEAGLSRMPQGHGGAHGADATHSQTRMAASEAT